MRTTDRHSGSEALLILLGGLTGAIPIVHPALLAAMLAAGRIVPAQVGRAAMFEAAGMLATSLIAATLHRDSRPRPELSAAGAAMLAAAAVCMTASGNLILAARALSGCAEGYVLWAVVVAIARSASPARLFAVFIAAEAVLGLALGQLLSRLVLAGGGVVAGYTPLLVIALFVAGAAWFLPPRLHQQQSVPRRPGVSWEGAAALAAAALFFSGLFALWVYLPQLLAEKGLGSSAYAMALGLVTGMQLLGGLAAIVLAARLPAAASLIVLSLVSAALVGVVTVSEDLVLTMACLAALGFLWMFCPALQMATVIVADPERSSATFIGPAQLAGMSLGPFLASTLVGPAGYGSPGYCGVGCLVAAAVLLVPVLDPSGRRRPGIAADRPGSLRASRDPDISLHHGRKPE